jgi:hypothetical protein
MSFVSRSFRPLSKGLLGLVITTAFSTMASAAASDFVGTWINTNRATRGIVRVVVSPSMQMRAYGACTPRPCDWGMSRMITYGRSVSDRNHTASTVHYTFPFKQVEVVGKLTAPNLLSLTDFNVFTDNSGRQNYYTEQRFRKATAAELAEEFKSSPQKPQD